MPTPKIYSWLKILAKFISVQFAVQVLSFLCGILIIRNLSKQEYAYFIIANTLQSAMNALADVGVSIGITSIGGTIWQDPYRFGQLLKTGMQLRIYFAVATVVTVTPILCWMLLSNGCSPFFAVLIVSAILIELYFYLIHGIFSVVLRLNSLIEQIQNLDLIVILCRLVLLTAAYFSVINVVSVVFASTIASGLQAYLVKKWTENKIRLDVPISLEYREKMIKISKTLLPSAIYFSLQGQISVFLISIFGSTTNIADIGALSRLAIIFALINSVINQILVPSFARCQTNRLLLLYLQIIGSYSAVGIAVIGVVILFPHQILWVLGQGYANLSNELILMIISTVFINLVSLMWSLNATRAWIEHSWIYIPATLLTQVLLLTQLDLSTVAGVIYFGMLSMCPFLVVNLWLSYAGFSNFRPAE
jgi:O-antigen/teichoic acid export membrane protein